ncbi:MAG: uncharacterized protein QOH61_2083 [Chloroflexota bacterium]|jgi:uncharacterized protein (DUF1684 family)|nr:uncharacterized protein [Chloroflexota bacterium]
MGETRNEYLELTDWRRRVASMWEAWRADAETDPEVATAQFRRAKDRLFAEHPQSPLLPGDRGTFAGLPYWPYDAAWRMTLPFELDQAAATGPHDDAQAAAAPLALPSSGLGGIPFRRIGRVQLGGPLDGRSLPVFWIDAYGGGLFVPFRDATSGTETYGAGRYLVDTIKSADHGGNFASGTLVLDFNLAYHPSCAYDPHWSCPLAPPESRLELPVRVGERLGPGTAAHS